MNFLPRQIQRVLDCRFTLEGAGVKLKRVLGNDENSTLDRSYF
jgi:hypothetical protein